MNSGKKLERAIADIESLLEPVVEEARDKLANRFTSAREGVIASEAEAEKALALRRPIWPRLRAQVIDRLNIPNGMLAVDAEQMTFSVIEPKQAERTWTKTYFTIGIATQRWSPSSGYRGGWIQDLHITLTDKGIGRDITARYAIKKDGTFNAKKMIERIEQRIRAEVVAKDRAARIAVARASQLDRLQAIVGDRAELRMEESCSRWGSRPQDLTYTKLIRGNFASTLGSVNLVSNADLVQDAAFVTVSLYVSESKLASILAFLDEKITAQ